MQQSAKKIDQTVDILGVPVFGGLMSEVIRRVGSMGMVGGVEPPMVILTPTTEQIVMAQDDDALCNSFMKADLNLPDTWGIWWASRWLRWRDRSRSVVSERMAGVDVALELALKTLEMGKKVLLLGGRKGVAEKAAEAILAKSETRNSKLETNSKFKIQNSKLIAWDSGTKDIAHETKEERERVMKKIAGFGPHLVLVAYGAPWQEKWVTANREALGRAGVAVVMVVGGAFDMWAGRTPRAPVFVRTIGMEWAWRLVIEPWRIGRQIRLLTFLGMVVRASR